MTLFERFFGETPEEHLKKIGADKKTEKQDAARESKPSPESASHEEIIRAWGTQPDASDPSSRAADRIVLKQIEEDRQAQKPEAEEEK